MGLVMGLIAILLFGCLVGVVIGATCVSPKSAPQLDEKKSPPSLGPYRDAAQETQTINASLVIPIIPKYEVVDFSVARYKSGFDNYDTWTCRKCSFVAKCGNGIIGNYCQCAAHNVGHFHPTCPRCNAKVLMRSEDDPAPKDRTQC